MGEDGWAAAYEALLAAMAHRGRVLVAYSGGVDSGLVAKVAYDALGDDALAVITDAETLSRRELDEAVAEAKEIGIDLRVVPVSELAREDYRRNLPNRCYFCRKELADVLLPIQRDGGFAAVADGINLSDLGDHRPGIRAMDEEGFWHPLVEAGMTKDDVRALAKALGLSFWAKPSNACLSSRIAYGEVITLEKLRQVEEAENLLRSLGFGPCRVRHHGAIARIEVRAEDLPRLLSPEIAGRVEEGLRELGFVYVTADLRGYRSGSMNDVL
jgi:uncharacterized protein